MSSTARTAASTLLQVTSAAGPSAAFQTASLQVNILTLAKCPASSCAVTKPLLAPAAAPNATQANKTAAAAALPLNATMDAMNGTTIADAINATAGALDALNGTAALDAPNATAAVDALNATAAVDALNATVTSALDALNRSDIKGDAASKAAVAGVQPAEASKPKSAAVGSSPMSVFAAACAMAVVGVFAL